MADETSKHTQNASDWFKGLASSGEYFAETFRADVVVSNYDSDPFRFVRLGLFLGYLFPPGARGLPIENVHDHKGCLTVKWSRRPSVEEAARVRRAWACLNEEAVDHIWPGGTSGDGLASDHDHSFGSGPKMYIP